MSAPAAPLLVYGLGRSGLAVVRRARAAGQPVAFYERRQAGADVAEALGLGAERLPDVAAWLAAGARPGVAVAAPGVPIDHPDLARLRAAGGEVIGEVEWVYRRVPGRYLAVTGTAGKGSVTRWSGDTLAAAGYDVAVGGNIDPALAAVARPGALHVVEMSSFQLERCPTFAPDVAVLLNLGEDHIDRHGSVAAYHAAKRQLVANLRPGQRAVVNADDPLLAGWARELEGAGVDVLRFSLAGPADAYRDADGLLWLAGEPLLHESDLHVLGAHQVANGLAVALACAALGVGGAQLTAGLRGFTGLPGRYAAAGSVGGVRFVEDSIATRPLAVRAALEATPRPLVWLAGGQAKGAAVEELAPLVAETVDLLVTFGESGAAFAEAFAGVTEVARCSEPDGDATMRCLVDTALAYLRERHGGVGHVLLAPLAASFDQFPDYRARGQAFRLAVAAAGAASGSDGAARGSAAPAEGA
ncbi:MAG: UDP-N-acetylmuramoyl-L-alanine--D-glutamate ligase [Deinococcales bacterium]|nr:UDP-N-acetylmuramoyl-L-alanine--D-glutamate ligase [Deinococcales bacterium]